MERPAKPQLRKLVGVGNFQFGKQVGSLLFGRGVRIQRSRKTGRIRHIYLRNKLIATLRPKDGFLALTPEGAELILQRVSEPPNCVVVDDSVADPIKHGGDVFAKHVRSADSDLRPGEEVIVTDTHGRLLGVGSAVLAGREMPLFRRGVAVNLRKGVDEDTSSTSEFPETQ